MIRQADLIGINGRAAWRNRISHEGSARLEVWLLNVPGAHPFWSYWQASVVHLRDIVGVEPAARQYPEAEYELSVFALDPRQSIRQARETMKAARQTLFVPECPDPDGDDWRFLTPNELVYQFHGVSTADAKAILYSYVSAIVEKGIASPDSDYADYWRRCLDKTVGNFRSGRHAVQ